jgi:hypothetical protein
MKVDMRNSFLVVLLLLCTGVVCQGQINERQAKAKAETATRVGANYPESHLLRAHRREDLEDDLFRVQTKPRGKIAKAAYFYEVSGEGYFVLSPDEALYVDSADGHLVRLVAVSASTGEAYLLSGFKNADFEFNRLARDASLSIESSKDAEMYARLYFTAVADPSGERLIYGSRPLKHKIEDYFFSSYPEKEAERLSKQWWSGFDSRKSNVLFASLASKNSFGYETTLAVMSSSPNRIPVLDLWTLQISTDGPCQTKSIRAIYPAKPGV